MAREEILKRIADLEKKILDATPSDNWSIGERSSVK